MIGLVVHFQDGSRAEEFLRPHTLKDVFKGKPEFLDGKIRRTLIADKNPALFDEFLQIFNSVYSDSSYIIGMDTSPSVSVYNRRGPQIRQNDHIEPVFKFSSSNFSVF